MCAAVREESRSRLPTRHAGSFPPAQVDPSLPEWFAVIIHLDANWQKLVEYPRRLGGLCRYKLGKRAAEGRFGSHNGQLLPFSAAMIFVTSDSPQRYPGENNRRECAGALFSGAKDMAAKKTAKKKIVKSLKAKPSHKKTAKKAKPSLKKSMRKTG